MTEKRPATTDKNKVSIQDSLKQLGVGRLRFFFALLGYILYLTILAAVLGDASGGAFRKSATEALVVVPLAMLLACRLANVGCPGALVIGFVGSAIFWKSLWVTLGRLKYDPESATAIAVIFALVIIVLLVIPPKAKPESTADKGTPEN